MLKILKNNNAIFFLLLLLFAAKNSSGQTDFRWPLSKRNTITGNYGELRPNHFHMGMDVSTNNTENWPVYAAEEGFVSRIRVSANGYGRSMYITHPNGFLTLYAHLNKFEEPIASYISAEMHKQQLNEIDFYLPDSSLKVSKGQLIALSGNTGGSSGPHLHFEIRDTKSEVPLNPILFFPFSDINAPVLKSLAILNLSDTSFQSLPQHHVLKPLKQSNDTMVMADHIISFPFAGFAFSAYDLLEARGNQNQVSKAFLTLDSTLIYAHEFSKLKFEDARYVNEYSFKLGREKMQRCFLPEQYPDGIYTQQLQRGIIRFKDTSWHRYALRLTDDAGNSRVIIGRIKSKQISTPPEKICKGIYIRTGRDTILSVGNYKLQISKRTLYNSACLEIKDNNSAIFIAPASVNILQPVRIFLFDTSANRQKRILTNGATIVPARLSNDSLVFELKSLGQWRLQSDTIAPIIKLINQKNKTTKPSKTLRVALYDNQSGIGNYNVYINKVWTLSYYDAKSKTLLIELNDKLKHTRLDVRIEASDKCENIRTKSFSVLQ